MDASPSLSSQDLATLSSYCQVLGLPSRLQLLSQLQVPRTLQEIRLSPGRKDQLGRRDRSVSRQALTGHLRRLHDIGLVEGLPSKRNGRQVTEYRVNQARLFSVVEELRRVSLIRPAGGAPGLTAIQDGGAAFGATELATAGPGLTMVNGPLEGRGFELSGRGPWTIGRAVTCAACIAHDPFVSKSNTVIHRSAAGAGGETGWMVEARPDARNGTLLNWRRMESGEIAPLRNGDVLRVGRTLLVLRGA